MDNAKHAAIFKALGEDTRIQIFEMLRNGTLCACKIQEKFNLTQPTLSHHLKILCDSGLVKSEKNGRWIFYSLNCEILDTVIKFISDAKCKREKCQCD